MVEVGSGLQTKIRATTTIHLVVEAAVSVVSEVVLQDLRMHRGALAVLRERRAQFLLVAVPQAVPQILAVSVSDPPQQFLMLVLVLLRSVVDPQRRRLRFRMPTTPEEE